MDNYLNKDGVNLLNKNINDKISKIKEYIDNKVIASGNLTTEQIINVNKIPMIENTTTSFKNLSDNSKNGYISIIDDDGDTSFLTKLKPVFDEFNIKIDIAVNAGAIGNEKGKMTWEQLKQLKTEGYEILNHGYMHQSPKDLTIEQLKQNYEKEKNEFILNGIYTYDYYVYAGEDGQTENSVKK